MKAPLLLLSLALLGASACQSDSKSAARTELQTRRTPEGLALTLSTDQLFAARDGKLTAQAAQALEPLVEQLKQQQAKQLIIRCYTDNQGDDNQNLLLTQERVQAVATWLREHGIEAPAEPQGMGEANPVAANAKTDGSPDPAGQARNRRLEVVVMK